MVQFSLLAVLLIAGSCYATSGQSRIVGGVPTTIEKYPGIVQVEVFASFSWLHHCGGSIINELYILSSAHCYAFLPSILFRVRAGATYRGVGGVTSSFANINNHPTFSVFRLEADITCVRLATPLVFNDVIQQTPIVPQGYEVADLQSVVFAGWGRLEFDGVQPDVLQEVEVLTINRDLCQHQYATAPNPATVSQTMICTGIPGVGGKGVCQGDSGGPLYYEGYVVGIISWGETCANTTYPDVSTKVSSYTNWIVDVAI